MRGYILIGHWERQRRSWDEELDGLYDRVDTVSRKRGVYGGGEIYLTRRGAFVVTYGISKKTWSGRYYSVHRRYWLNREGILEAIRRGFISEEYIDLVKQIYGIGD